MAQVERFEDLRVWRRGIELVKQVYLLTKEGEFLRDFGLRDQLRRATVSIPTNIAEGYERASRKEYTQFLNIAKGSAGEVRSLLRVAIEIGYINESQYNNLYNQVLDLSRMLATQIQVLRQRTETDKRVIRKE
jgi:four helix bundle protein